MTDDETLAMALLGGLLAEDSKGRVSHTHLEPGSDQEREAWAALARLFRNHDRELSVGLRHRLAALSDPEHPHEPRELVIKPRRRGPQPSHLIDVEIARFVAEAVNNNEQVEAAVQLAVERYGKSRAEVYRAWEKHGQVWVIRDSLN
jgi:hypothetical protein